MNVPPITAHRAPSDSAPPSTPERTPRPHANTDSHASSNPHCVTAAVRAGIDSDPAHGAVVPPIYLSSNYSFAGFDQKRTYDYTRSGNPTRDQLGDALARLETGAGAVVTSSGMSAIHLVTCLLAPDDLLIAPRDCYGGTYRLFTSLAKKRHLRLRFVDLSDPEALRAAIAEKPSLVWLETPSNPLLRITDISAATDQAHAVGAMVVVDNTFLSPILQRPIASGADLVVHSTTKYLNGHSDVVGGAVVARTAELSEQLAWWANCIGITGSPFDSYLTLRGIRTLAARMRVHEENARAMIGLLMEHPAVERVYHPSLPDHPGHEIAARQQTGFGPMLSFDLRGGESEVVRFLNGLEYFTLAESLGGVESLVAHPATMTHAAMDPTARRTAGISDALIRVSVGIEDASDLRGDLRRALDRALAPKD
ncbi:MAG: cystathionine gamma-synthase [Nannocystaceae bacterium]